MTVIATAVFKLTFARSKMCTKFTNITVLFLFCDDRLKVKQCQITFKTKITNILKFKQDYLFTKYYIILIEK